jgi:two-component system, OmpR family, alkaline phosphatase synthesis response regulator PhoP
MAKILVIEDERTTRANIVNFLESEGFKTLAAENGRLGIQLAQEHLPDLIICDILMPELDGYDVLTTLQQETQTASIPFIFLTITATEAGFRQSLDLGADDYLSKPITSEQLRAAILAQLRKQEDLQTNLVYDEALQAAQPLNPDLQQLLAAKDQLFDQLSFQLKQHLGTLSRTVQTLKQTPALDPQSQIHASHLNDLQDVTMRMLVLINEITTLHRLLTPENSKALLEQFGRDKKTD